MTHVHPTEVSIGADTSPVYAPSFSQNTSCAPIPIAVDRAASTAAGMLTNGGQITTSACVEEATSGENFSKKADVSAADLYIFQLPAITGFRMLLQNSPKKKFTQRWDSKHGVIIIWE